MSNPFISQVIELIPERGNCVLSVTHRVDLAAVGPVYTLSLCAGVDFCLQVGDVLASHEASIMECQVLSHKSEIMGTLSRTQLLAE